MSGAQHTLGTWYEASDRIRDEASDAIVATIEDGGHVEDEIFNSAARKKHARLIAAAPDLLEALTVLRNTIGDLRNGFAKSVDTARWVEQFQATADRAIAKAEGKP